MLSAAPRGQNFPSPGSPSSEGAFPIAQASKPGAKLKFAGIALFILGTLCGYPLELVPRADRNITVYLLAVAFTLMMLAGAFLYLRGRQYAARAVAKAITTDSNPHILYLRSFRQDASTKWQIITAASWQAIFAGFASHEEQLAEALQPLGELIAIGKPGEVLPRLGAARMYVSDDEWKEVVLNQMQAARLVVIRAGKGENLLWEFTQAAGILDTHKLLILALKLKRKDYESFRAMANKVLPTPLPEARALKRFGKISGFLCFTPDWTPRFLKLRAPFFRKGFKPFRRMFQFALRPVFEEQGVPWRPPSVSILMIAAISVLTLIATAFALLLPGAARKESEANKADQSFSQTIASFASVQDKQEIRSRSFLQSVADNYNKSLPRILDNDTKVQSVSAEEALLIFNYTLRNYSSEQIDPTKFQQGIEVEAPKSACQDKETKTLLENGISVQYVYAGNNGQRIAKLLITPQTCGLQAE